MEAVPYARKQTVPADPPLKASRDFKYIGKSTPIKDAREIGMGRTLFSSDAMPDGVRFAVVVRCPVWNGKLANFDATAAKAVKDVVDVVKTGDKIAVIATNTWAAMKAAKLVAVDWEEGEHAESSTDKLTELQKQAVANPARKGFQQGDFESAYASADIKVEEEFSAPFLSHNPMETPNCTAWYHDGGLEIWTGCQSLNRLYDKLPEYAGLPWDKITFHQLRIGGGFGRKLAHDYIIEVVDIAKQVDYPVKLIFTKEDDIRHDVYRAADRLRYRVGMRANGYPLALQEMGSRNAKQKAISKIGLFFENIEKRFSIVQPPVLTGPLRAPNDNVTSFTEQSMIDCMAEKAGIDPMTYRLALHGDADAVAELGWEKAPVEDKEIAELLRIVKKRSGWKSDSNFGYGVAFFEKYGSHIALVALAPKVASIRRIEKVFAAVNCGRIINPLSARAQVEGAIIDGMAAALYQKIDIRNGQVVQGNYHDYKILTITQTPEIDIVLVDSEDQPQGLGETAYPPMMPATVSAIYDATGRRTRDLPVY
jgi:isoquinoline 1-oxidoreductase beta subunit